MRLPLPVQDGWSLVAACRTRRELVQLLAGLALETDAPDAISEDDYGEFRAACRDLLPAAEAEWIATVTLQEIRAEAARQLRDDSDLAALRDERLWRYAATDHGLVELPDALAARRERFWLLRRRRSEADALAERVDAEYDRLMQEPSGGWSVHPRLLVARRWRTRPPTARLRKHP